MAAACLYAMLLLQEQQTVTAPNRVPASGPPWLALVVRSRHEKSVQTILDSKGYRTSVPLVRCIHTRHSGSAWDSHKPLIAGYVFAVHDWDNPFRIVTTPGLVHIVSFGKEPATIPEAEIEALERIAASGLPVGRCGYTRTGQMVELIDGPLRGVQGIVLRQAKTTRLIVSVEMLQRAVVVEIEAAWAYPIQ
jgi:transcription antitermination factor NusG